MKIIRKGNLVKNNMTIRWECWTCHSIMECDTNEASIDYKAGFGNILVVFCPVCGQKHWIKETDLKPLSE